MCVCVCVCARERERETERERERERKRKREKENYLADPAHCLRWVFRVREYIQGYLAHKKPRPPRALQ